MPDPLSAIAESLSDRYRIERELGQGGMATVYLAEDLRHDRKVAIKVLKPELAAVIGGERFLAEIKTTANLQHPHILPLFDSGQADSFLYFVMPYVEGESLREKLDREGELPVEEAVRVATGVAGALDYAHRQGVIHRDIKPANILLHDGEPLVSDFGIALAVSAAGGGRLTETGLSLGTPYYMSPEQATAERDPDARSDVYALGCVLYEMLIGDPPFTGSSAQAVLGKILTTEPVRPTEHRHTVPVEVEAVVLKALEKRPADRFSSAQALADALAGRAAVSTASIGTGAGTLGRWRPWLVPTIALLGGVSLGWVGWATLRGPSSEPRHPVRWDVVLPASAPLALAGPAPVGTWQTALAVSPGGRLAYVSPSASTTRLSVREIDGVVRTLESTEGAYLPAFSPDGNWVAFASEGRLMKVPVSGGSPVTLIDKLEALEGLLWTPDGRLLITHALGVGWVPESGGAVERFPLTPALPMTRFGDFTLLPGGEWALGTMMVTGQIAVLSLQSGSLRAVTLGGTVSVDSANWTEALVGAAPRYTAGYLTYLSNGDGALMAIPFDVSSVEVRGTPFPVLPDVRRESPRRFGQYAISGDGTLFYVPGRNEEFGRLALVGQNGTIDTLPFPRAQYHGLHLSPDGARIVAFEWSETVAGSGIKILDLRSGAVERLSLPPGYHYATGAWTPGGDTLAIKRYTPVTSQGRGLVFYRMSDRATLEFAPGSSVSSMVFLPDASGYLWNGLDLRVNLTSLRTGETERGPELGFNPAISPSGNAVAFIRAREGSIGVTRFPLAANWTPVVAEGTPDEPRWGPGGESLIYRDLDSFKEVELVISDDGIEVGEPRVIARGPFTRVFHSPYSVTSDGRILVLLGSGTSTAPSLRVITHFDLEIERRAPQGG